MLIALLIWRSVRVETDVLQSHEQLIKTNTKAITTSAIQTISFEMLKIDRWMADHPDYAKSLTVPDEQESETGMAVAEVYADFIDAVISQENLLPDDHMHAWRDYFHQIINMWPQLRKYMNAHPGWYLEEQNRLLNRHGHYYDKPGALARTANEFIGALAEAGISIAGTHALRVRGRKTGELRAVVVNVLTVGGSRYLVSPRGNTQWARNARAAGVIQLGPRWHRKDIAITEVDDDNKPVLCRSICAAGTGKARGTSPD